ncbi:MAG: ABC transporter ATP-binding protein [Dehalococcoidia bacterium]
MSETHVLRLRDVVKVYGHGEGEARVLDGVSLDLAAGEVVAVMGPSGSGKTTLLTIAGALQRPTSGTVEVAGEEIQSLSQGALAVIRREKVGFIFQGFNLLQALNARENVEYGLQLAGHRGGQARERAGQLLSMVGIAHRAEALPKELSGGEQQRVSIARALAGNRSVLLADEPTASLDEKRANEVIGLLRALAQDMGVGVLMVTHDLRVRDQADRVLWLEGGRLAAR